MGFLYCLPQDAESPQYNLDTNALDGENRVCGIYKKVSTNITDDHLGFGKDIDGRCTFHSPSRGKLFLEYLPILKAD